MEKSNFSEKLDFFVQPLEQLYLSGLVRQVTVPCTTARFDWQAGNRYY